MQPPGSDLILSFKSWERQSIDIVGPKPMTRSKNQYLLKVVGFCFAFPLRNITSSGVIKSLSTLFAIFGTPGFIHSDRGPQFVSSKFQNFCCQNGIATSKSTPYYPQGNAMTKTNATTELCERPFSACYTPLTAHSLTGKVSYHQFFRRSGHSSIPSPKRVRMTDSFVLLFQTR